MMEMKDTNKSTRRKLILNNPELKDALGVVLDLAGDNMLDEDDPSIKNYDPLYEQAKMQGKAMELVHEFYDTL